MYNIVRIHILCLLIQRIVNLACVCLYCMVYYASKHYLLHGRTYEGLNLLVLKWRGGGLHLLKRIFISSEFVYHVGSIQKNNNNGYSCITDLIKVKRKKNYGRIIHTKSTMIFFRFKLSTTFNIACI